MDIVTMLLELRRSDLIEIAVNEDGFCESYRGLRTDTVTIVTTEDEFLVDRTNSLCLNINGKTLDNNIKIAYKLMLRQKQELPHII